LFDDCFDDAPADAATLMQTIDEQPPQVRLRVCSSRFFHHHKAHRLAIGVNDARPWHNSRISGVAVEAFLVRRHCHLRQRCGNRSHHSLL